MTKEEQATQLIREHHYWCREPNHHFCKRINEAFGTEIKCSEVKL